MLIEIKVRVARVVEGKTRKRSEKWANGKGGLKGDCNPKD